MPSDLPSQHRALQLETIEGGFHVKTLPTPQPNTGNAIVQVIAAPVISYHREIYNGERHYTFPKPLVGGLGAVARIAATGPDAAILQPGQLVFVDSVIRGRDDPSVLFLAAIHEGFSEGSKKLSWGEWRDGTFAQFAKVPLENCIPLNEARLCQELGYSHQDLAYLCYLLVPYGGLRDIKLEPGETIVVCPATGGFGGAGALVAAAMGARVIAMGRNEKELARLKDYITDGIPGASIETAKLTGNESEDTAALQPFGPIDAVLDVSPPAAANSMHLRSAIHSLRRGGRCSLMGSGQYAIVDWKLMSDNITLKGKLMYEREDMLLFVKMLERGLFPKGKDLVDVKAFGMENWKEAFDAAAEFTRIGRLVVITP